VVETSFVEAIEGALADPMMTVVDLITTIATIASNSGATTASAVSVAGAAAKTRRRLMGENQLPKVVQGVRFQNGIEVIEIYRAGTGSGRICISWQTCNTKNKT
jgi:ribosomal protein L7/L12